MSVLHLFSLLIDLFLLIMMQATINCGYKDTSRPDWLIPMDKDKLPQPAKEMFPKKAKFQVLSSVFVHRLVLNVATFQVPGQARVSQNRIKVNLSHIFYKD